MVLRGTPVPRNICLLGGNRFWTLLVVDVESMGGNLMRSVRSAATLIAVVVLAAACSPADSNAPDLPQDVPSQGDPSGPQPVDIYQAEKLGLLDYAQRVVRNKCLAEAGYPQNLNGMGEYTPLTNYLRFSPRNFIGFTSEEEARTQGFGHDQPAEPARIISFDPNYDAALERCADEAWTGLGPEAEQMYHTYADLANQISNVLAARMRSVQPPLTQTLIACLESAGFEFKGARENVGLLELPSRFVTLGQYGGPPDDWQPNPVPGTVQVSGPVPARDWQPSDAERELAVAVYRCDEESGRVDQLWDAHYSAQVEGVSQLESSFAELNPQLDRLAAEASTIIAAR